MEIESDFRNPIEALDYLIEAQRQALDEYEESYRIERGMYQVECLKEAFLPSASTSLNYRAYNTRSKEMLVGIEHLRAAVATLLAFRERLLEESSLETDILDRFRHFPSLPENDR